MPDDLIQNGVGADALANPVQAPKLTPVEDTLDPSIVRPNVSAALNKVDDTIVRADTEASRQRDELLEQQLTFQGVDGNQIRNDAFEQAGGVEADQALRNAQADLRALNEGIQLRGVRIAGADGQTLAQGQREITLAQREQAVFAAAKAAEVEALQGNVDSANAAADRAVQIAFAEQDLELRLLQQNLDDFSAIAGEEQQQLVQQRQRELDEQRQDLLSARDLASQAIASGGATSREVAMLNDPSLSVDEKRAVAQDVIARTTQEDRSLERAIQGQQFRGAQAAADIKELELSALQNPTGAELDAETLSLIDGLSDGQRETITNARETVNEISEMVRLVRESGDIRLLTRGTEEGREFARLSKNVVDKLARERTGAVVGADEEKTFKDIVGVGVFNLVSKDDTEVVEGLESMLRKHQEALALNDPTGRVQLFLESKQLDAESSDEADIIWGVPSPNTN